MSRADPVDIVLLQVYTYIYLQQIQRARRYKLKKLHWLPIQQRIKFNIGVITFKILNTLQSSYLVELLTLRKPRRSLRSSSDEHLLETPLVKFKLGSPSFSFAAQKFGILHLELFHNTYVKPTTCLTSKSTWKPLCLMMPSIHSLSFYFLSFLLLSFLSFLYSFFFSPLDWFLW